MFLHAHCAQSRAHDVVVARLVLGRRDALDVVEEAGAVQNRTRQIQRAMRKDRETKRDTHKPPPSSRRTFRRVSISRTTLSSHSAFMSSRHPAMICDVSSASRRPRAPSRLSRDDDVDGRAGRSFSSADFQPVDERT